MIERMRHAARIDETGNAFKILHKIQLMFQLIVLISIRFLKIVTLSSTHRLNSRRGKDLEKLMSTVNEASVAVRTQEIAIALK